MYAGLIFYLSSLSHPEVYVPSLMMALGTVVLCIDPGAFRPAEEYLETAGRFKQRLLAVPPAQGFDQVLMPGDPEQRMRRERREQGIPVPEATWEAIGQAARERGVALD